MSFAKNPQKKDDNIKKKRRVSEKKLLKRKINKSAENQIIKSFHNMYVKAHRGPKKKASHEKPIGMISILIGLLLLFNMQKVFVTYIESPKVPFVEGTSPTLLLSINTACLRALASPLKHDSIM